jgi:hypothetical protein
VHAISEPRCMHTKEVGPLDVGLLELKSVFCRLAPLKSVFWRLGCLPSFPSDRNRSLAGSWSRSDEPAF